MNNQKIIEYLNNSSSENKSRPINFERLFLSIF